MGAGLRYSSANSVKREAVPDRNVLPKGICWTVPSMPWVLESAGVQPNIGQEGVEGGWGGVGGLKDKEKSLLCNSLSFLVRLKRE